MCLVKSHKFPKRAKEDIICFKKLLCDNGSFFIYFIGEPITSPIQKGKSNKISQFIRIFKSLFIKYITNGFVHVYSNRCENIMNVLLNTTSENTTYFICKIPKGAFYYQNENYTELAATRIQYLIRVKGTIKDAKFPNDIFWKVLQNPDLFKNKFGGPRNFIHELPIIK